MATALTAETISEPAKALQNVSTLKPSINVAENQNNVALITNMNSPRDRMVIGRVKMNRIGRTNKLSNPRITAAMMAG